MKAYTDLEQSKRLAEILPLESADMFYRSNSNDVKLMWEHLKDIPLTNACWGLATLLEVLPNQFGRYTKTLYWFDDAWHCEYVDEDYEAMTNGTSANNPIDACYKMIILLHERNLL